jgi:NAD(P)-dependent dehydrogenase (short-subunit alcohol dehydrogenase family)
MRLRNLGDGWFELRQQVQQLGFPVGRNIFGRRNSRFGLLDALLVSQAFVPFLKKSGAPRIVNVSSGGGDRLRELPSSQDAMKMFFRPLETPRWNLRMRILSDSRSPAINQIAGAKLRPGVWRIVTRPPLLATIALPLPFMAPPSTLHPNRRRLVRTHRSDIAARNFYLRHEVLSPNVLWSRPASTALFCLAQ